LFAVLLGGNRVPSSTPHLHALQISVDERRSIPHHLLDILSPENDFTAGDFYHRARAATQDILSRGRTPIVVGGTGFYLRWFILGKPSTPASTKDSEAVAEAAVQKALQQAEDAAGQPLSADAKWAAAVGLVASLGDEESAQRLSTEVNNWYRLYRVVDILLQSPGRTLAQLNLDEAAPLDYDFRCYFLYRPRMELYRRIDRRVEDMVMNGVVEETGRVLISRGLRPNVNCATRAIGYRQVLEFLEAGAAAEHGPDEAAVVELARSIQGASRKLCHRQLNWFRDDGLFQWVDAERGDDELVDELVRLWNEPAHSGGSGSEHGRLNPDQAKAMKQYVTKMEVLKPKSKEVASALEQAKAVLGTMRGAGAVGEVQPGEEGAVAAKKQKTS